MRMKVRKSQKKLQRKEKTASALPPLASVALPASTVDILAACFKRYDPDGDGHINTAVEFEGLMVNVVYKLGGRLSPAIKSAVELRAEGYELGKLMDFQEFTRFYAALPDTTLCEDAVENNVMEEDTTDDINADHVVEKDTTDGADPDLSASLSPTRSHVVLEDANYHTWAILKATEPEASCGSILPLLLALVLLALQIMMCMLTVRELDSPRCLQSDACRAGMVCLGLGEGDAGGAGNSGSCYDCYYSLVDTDWAKLAAPDDFADALDYCTENDNYLTFCDFIQNRQDLATGATVAIVVAIAGLLSQVIAADQDEANTDWVVTVFRLHELRRKEQASAAFCCLVFCLSMFISVTRKWLLAPILIASALALMVSKPFNVENIILNGLATTFVMEMDNIVYVYLRRTDRSETDSVMEQLNEQFNQRGGFAEPLQITENISILLPEEKANFWLARVLGLSLAVIMMIQVFDPAKWQGEDVFRSDWLSFTGDGVSEPKSAAPQLCGEYSGVFFSPVLFSFFLMAANGLFIQRLHFTETVKALNATSRVGFVLEPVVGLGIALGGFTMFKEIVNHIFTKVAVGAS